MKNHLIFNIITLVDSVTQIIFSAALTSFTLLGKWRFVVQMHIFISGCFSLLTTRLLWSETCYAAPVTTPSGDITVAWSTPVHRCSRNQMFILWHNNQSNASSLSHCHLPPQGHMTPARSPIAWSVHHHLSLHRSFICSHFLSLSLYRLTQQGRFASDVTQSEFEMKHETFSFNSLPCVFVTGQDDWKSPWSPGLKHKSQVLFFNHFCTFYSTTFFWQLHFKTKHMKTFKNTIKEDKKTIDWTTDRKSNKKYEKFHFIIVKVSFLQTSETNIVKMWMCPCIKTFKSASQQPTHTTTTTTTTKSCERQLYLTHRGSRDTSTWGTGSRTNDHGVHRQLQYQQKCSCPK